MIIEMQVKEGLTVTVTEWLTKESLFVDNEGHIWARYIVEIKGVAQTRWNRLDDIDTAIWQHFHVLEGYLGQYVGLSKPRTRLPGEERIIRTIASELLSVAQSYLNKDIPMRWHTPQDVETYISKVLHMVGPVTNQFKEAAHVRLAQIKSPSPTDASEQIRIASEIIPAAGDLTQRVQEIIGKARSVKIRLAKLHRKKRQCREFFVNLYHALEDIYVINQKMPMAQWDEQEIQRICHKFDVNHPSLMSVMKTVNVQPYYGRAISPEIRRLRRLPGYMGDSDRSRRQYESAMRAVTGAMRKLERAIAEVDGRYQPKVTHLPRR